MPVDAAEIGVLENGRVRFVLPKADVALELDADAAERLGGTLVDAAIEAREGR
jgi:hypothetical protein